MLKPEPDVFWGEIAPCEHVVQIYKDDAVFMDTLEGFVHGGLKAGEAVIIIATESHRAVLDARLGASGHDMRAARLTEQYIDVDAEKTLQQFLVNDWPDPHLFEGLVADLISKARGPRNRRVRAFGEMVALMWARGQRDATIRLERLWHELCQNKKFSLLCAYPIVGFTQHPDSSMEDICSTHSRVVHSLSSKQ